jgi:regulator of protease activity HflC (stomatin/prohibitin superfamily)
MIDLFDFVAANWRWLIAAGIALTYLAKGVVIVKQWERVPIMRLGRYVRTLEPGISWIEPVTSRRLEARLVQDVVYSLMVPAVLTHDNVPVQLTITVTRFIAPEQVPQTVLAVADYHAAEDQRALSTVADLVGRRPIDYIFDKRVEFCEEVRATLQDRVKTWGLTIRAVELKDFRVADEAIARSIAMKARALKEAQAELARAEMQAEIVERLNKAAADLQPAGWRLKTLEVLVELTRSAQNNTILIPANLTEFADVLSAWRNTKAQL